MVRPRGVGAVLQTKAVAKKVNMMNIRAIHKGRLTNGESTNLNSQAHTLAGEPHPKRRSDLTYRIIEGETLILNREDGCLHQLNSTANFIWESCDGTFRIDQIIERLAEAYEVDSVTARRDVEEVLFKLRSSNLLQK
jgi:methyltransferase-like protein